jgi:AraC family transcriptional regulator of adaptative response/methylated-DNA-[protein]-cysteine methyltransferase
MNNYQVIERALHYIATQAKTDLDLNTIAAHVNLSPFHFQRVFKEWAGVSPKQFMQFLNIEHAKSLLNHEPTTDITYSVGLSSPGRLHDLFVSIEAMTPAEFRDGGKGLAINYSFHTSKFGDYLIASTSRGICALSFIESKETALAELTQKWSGATLTEGSDAYQQTVIDYLTHHLPGKDKIKLHLKGTNFQLKVWQALLNIPEGALRSYAQLATSIDSKAFRAVGTAISDNPVAFVIPCHRVINSIGRIGNYRWGKERKMSMIGWEAAHIS